MMKKSMKHLVSFYSLNLHQSRNISTKIPSQTTQNFTQKSHLVTSALPRPLIMDPPDNHSNHEPNEKPKVTNPISTILNTNLDGGNLDVLRREFSKTGKGSFELRKDETSGVATLTINNVERRNSFSGLMMAQFNEVLTQLEEWKEVRVNIVIIFFSFTSKNLEKFVYLEKPRKISLPRILNFIFNSIGKSSDHSRQGWFFLLRWRPK